MRQTRAIGWVIPAAMLASVLCLAQQSPKPSEPPSRHAPPPEPGPKPALRIDAAPLGYMPPSTFYLSDRLSSQALDFFDDDHLLFTFRVGGLLKRLPSDRQGDDDQEIRALVLDTRSGKVLNQSEWRMHDRLQYLWPFPDGKFLIRVRDALFLTDTSLTLTPYLSYDTPLEAIEISPDRRMMLVERDVPAKFARPDADGTEQVVKPVQIELVQPQTAQSTVFREASRTVHIPLLGDGIADVLEGNQEASWAVRNVPLQGQPQILTEVKSNCRPTVQPVSATVALVMGCYMADADRPVVAITTTGHELWRESWQSKFVWGWFNSAQNGSRFAYESLEVARPIGVFDSIDAEDISQQLVGVYDTESGKLVLVKDTTPVLTAGQNVALSPDGQRFAVLRHGAVEIYDLPPVSAPPAPAAGTKTAEAAKGSASSQ